MGELLRSSDISVADIVKTTKVHLNMRSGEALHILSDQKINILYMLPQTGSYMIPQCELCNRNHLNMGERGGGCGWEREKRYFMDLL